MPVNSLQFRSATSAVDCFIREVLGSRDCTPGRSGEIGIRSRLKICRDLVLWGFKSPLRHESKCPIIIEVKSAASPKTCFSPPEEDSALCTRMVVPEWAADLVRKSFGARLAGRLMTCEQEPKGLFFHHDNNR